MQQRRSLRRFLVHGFAVAFFLTAVAPRARAGEAYYLLMFAQQQVPNNVNYSHTFATFVKVSWTGDGPCPANPCVEVHTISWMPRRLRLRAWALAPECGINFDLHSTLCWGQGNAMRTSLWGPYEIEPQLYHAAVSQISLLEGGQVLYKLNDLGYRSDQVCNCIHAVNSVVDGLRRNALEPGWGDTASYRVLCHMEPWLLHPGTVHAWVGSALGLDRYPILYRDWSNPPGGILMGAIIRVFGGETVGPTYGRPAR